MLPVGGSGLVVAIVGFVPQADQRQAGGVDMAEAEGFAVLVVPDEEGRVAEQGEAGGAGFRP
ncbi:hypothetical protein D3C85_1789670 [compost metagenome]